MNAWAADKNEIEITDLILQLKQKLSELKDKHQSKLYYNINNQMDILIGKFGPSRYPTLKINLQVTFQLIRRK